MLDQVILCVGRIEKLLKVYFKYFNLIYMNDDSVNIIIFVVIHSRKSESKFKKWPIGNPIGFQTCKHAEFEHCMRAEFATSSGK